MIPFREERGIASPFRKLLLTDVYDGPKAGIAIDDDGYLYVFQFLDWDDQQDTRVYSVSIVQDVTWASVRSAFQVGEPEAWTEWVLPLSLPPLAESFLAQATATAQPVAVVASSDLLQSVDVWRPFTKAVGRPPNSGWLEWLGLSRRGRRPR